MEDIYRGDLEKDFIKSLKNKGPGWLIGNFSKFDEKENRKTSSLEMKYWNFKKEEPKSEHKSKVQCCVTELTLVLNGWIKGWVKKNGDKKNIKLCEGNYILIEPKVKNNLVVKKSENAKVLTIKAPSDTGDKIELNTRE